MGTPRDDVMHDSGGDARPWIEWETPVGPVRVYASPDIDLFGRMAVRLGPRRWVAIRIGDDGRWRAETTTGMDLAAGSPARIAALVAASSIVRTVPTMREALSHD